MSEEIRESRTASHVVPVVMEDLNRLTALANALTPDQKKEQAERRAKQQAEHGKNQAAAILREANAPRRQLAKVDLDRTGGWGQTFQAVAGRLGSGFLIALVGIRGNGKTQLAVELMRKLSGDSKPSYFCSAMEFFMEFKAAYSLDKSDGEKGVLRRFCAYPFLVIDEIGQRSENDWENRLLFELLNRRYQDCKDTLLISNQDVEKLEAALGLSAVSRMRESGGVVSCSWPSFR